MKLCFTRVFAENSSLGEISTSACRCCGGWHTASRLCTFCSGQDKSCNQLSWIYRGGWRFSYRGGDCGPYMVRALHRWPEAGRVSAMRTLLDRSESALRIFSLWCGWDLSRYGKLYP